MLNIIEACEDEKLFAPFFKDPETWRAWRAFLCALFLLCPCRQRNWRSDRECTKRDSAPVKRFDVMKHGLSAGGARKVLHLPLIAVFLAVFKDWRPYLVPGERGHSS